MKLVMSQNVSHGRLVVLAPRQARVPGSFARLETSSDYYEHLLRGVQRFRGKVYKEDGAIRESEISRDGRHRHPADERAWHLVSLDRDGEVCGCSRYLAHPNTVGFSQLGVRTASISHSWEWRMRLRTAIDSEVIRARNRGLAYAEVGGWALDSTMRRTTEGIRIALATFSLARILGGCIGITTATRRHCSASILRRIGGRPLRINDVELPPYYDPQYQCEMELFRFDSAEPNPRFEEWIDDLRQCLTSAVVVRPGAPAESLPAQTAAAHQASLRHAWGFEAWGFATQ